MNTNTVPAVIEAVRALIADPSRRCCGAEARDAAGNPCDPCSPEARCWCVYGAMERAAAGDATLADETDAFLVGTAREELPELFSLAQLNDDSTTSHADVVALLGRARDRLVHRIAA